MKLRQHEMICTQCDGAGTEPGGGVWELKLCRGCNGHGAVIYDKFHHKVVKFDVDATVVATKKATIDGRSIA